MKVFSLILVLNCLVLPQNYKNELLRQVEKDPTITVEKIGDEIYLVNSISGLKTSFKTGIRIENTNIAGLDTTIIYIDDIDTSLYSGIFKFWQRIPTSNNVEPLVVGDVNNNDLIEIYGFEYEGSQNHHTVVYESNDNGIFNLIYEYPNLTHLAKNIYDVNNDGLAELHLLRLVKVPVDSIIYYIVNKQAFYEKPAYDSLATNLSFEYLPQVSGLTQLNDMTFGDFDKDGITDCVMIPLVASNPYIRIVEYNEESNNLDSVYNFTAQNPLSRGFNIGDFDEDGWAEIIFGDDDGIIYVIEVKGNNLYEKTWEGDAQTWNAWLHMQTDDIDKNGLPEFWIGGQFFDQYGRGITRLTCFEAAANNIYKPVARIDIIGVFSFFTFYSIATDIGDDGTEELCLFLGPYTLILKFEGDKNNHNYQIYYAQINEPSLVQGSLRAGTLYDLDNDGNKELLLTIADHSGSGLEYFTYIYKLSPPVSVDDKTYTNIEPTIKLQQNFPNPFNPSTQIKYSLAQDVDITLKVYDMLGTEVAELINETQAAGNHTINFNADNLSSGVYIYRITATNNGRILFSDSKQMILLR
jgi:Secretion system C-terminal sorting domain